MEAAAPVAAAPAPVAVAPVTVAPAAAAPADVLPAEAAAAAAHAKSERQSVHLLKAKRFLLFFLSCVFLLHAVWFERMQGAREGFLFCFLAWRR